MCLKRFRLRVPLSSISPSHLTSVTTPAEVLAAVRQKGLALEFAAEALQGDREIASWLRQFAVQNMFFHPSRKATWA